MYLQMSYWPQTSCNIPLAMVKQLHILHIIYTKAKILWILNLSLYMHTHSNNLSTSSWLAVEMDPLMKLTAKTA